MANLGTNDTAGPMLTALSIPTVDVTHGSMTPFATVAIGPDGETGSVLLTLDRQVLFLYPYFIHGAYPYSPGSTIYYETDGQGRVGTYDQVDVSAGSGTYTITQAVVTTSAGSRTYSTSALAALGFSTSFTVIGDTTPPVLTSFTINTAASTGSSDGFVTFNLGVNDTGLAHAVIHLDRTVIVDGQPTYDLVVDHGTGLHTVPGFFDTGAHDGPQSGFIQIGNSQFTPGDYHVMGVSVSDYAGNETDYTPTQLAALGDPTEFTISTEPRLTSFQLPAVVDVRSSVHTIQVAASATDNGASVSRIVLTLDRPVEDAGQENHGLHNPMPTTTITSTFYSDGSLVTYPVLDPETDTGHYTVVNATVYDDAGGSTTYTTDQLAALNFSTGFDVLSDDSAPVVSALSLPAAVVAGEAFTAVVGVTDLLPSTNIVSGTLQLTGPDGTSSSIGINRALDPYQNYEYDQFHGGLGVAHATLSAPGTYTVSAITLTDYAGNTATYDTAELAAQGYATSIVVAQPGTLPDAAITGDFAYSGTAGADDLFLNGNVGDYALSRVAENVYSGDVPSRIGDFVLTGLNGSGAFSIGESIETVHFQNGQFLALHDLPAYIAGSAALSLGGGSDDQLFQSRLSGYEEFVGGAGNDQLYLKGNVNDYAVRAVSAVSAPDGTQLSGFELIGLNGSGALVIDQSVDTIHFQNGQYLAFGDITHYVRAADPFGGVLHLLPDELAAGSASVTGSATVGDVLLLNGNAGDYALGRDGSSGAFVLSGDGHVVSVDQTIDTVQFGSGQYLALHDLPAYLGGSAVFTTGTDADDLLFVPLSGDQYVYGGAGRDDLYVNGNTHDYALEQVSLAANADHHAITGVELIGNNGSGNIFIDQSVETVHFQDGQYLAFEDIPAYVHGSDIIS